MHPTTSRLDTASRRALVIGLAALFSAAAAVLTSTPANACGGFFCNAATLAPIFQSGERVLFIQNEGTVTMHIEVSYSGEPTDFGWIVPIADVPLGATGQPLPLDQILQTSDKFMFAALENGTNPTWTQTFGQSLGKLCEDRGGFGCAGSLDFAAADSAGVLNTVGDIAPQGPPPVTVVDTAKVGPFDAQLIDATSSDALFDWLNTSGYFQDPAAKPLLAHYVSQGFKFIGIRLQSGNDAGDIEPISLTLGENAPCVPLRLTGIAATDGMPMRIWVLGDARAVPKNFLHAVLNEQAIDYAGGTNYNEVVDAAIKAASGRAFVTEYAGPVAEIQEFMLPSELLPDLEERIERLSRAESLSDLQQRYQAEGFPNGPDIQQILGFQAQTDRPVQELIDDVIQQVIRPRAAMREMLGQSKFLTRLYTRIDPDAMTRDPIFGFNDTLPDVPLQRVVELQNFTDEDCNNSLIATYPDGRRVTVEGSTFPNFVQAGAPPLLGLEVLDETGDPVPVPIEQAEEVDAMLEMAELGTPVLSDQERAAIGEVAPVNRFPNPPAGFAEGEGCSIGARGGTALILFMSVMFLFVRRRRYVAT